MLRFIVLTVGPNMNEWLPQTDGSIAGACSLYCLPHAGGGSALYHRWERLVPADIRIRPIKLPGRESRLEEPPLDNMADAVDALMRHVGPEVKSPFALFGHSMGGMLAFEFAHALARQSLEPDVLFVSASRAPHLVRTDEPLHRLPDDEMIAALIENYGRGEESTSDELKMMRWMAGTIRADLRLMETYEYQPKNPLSCPIVAVSATEDTQVTAAHVNQWRQYTSGRFTFRTIPGHHFFLREQEQSIVQLVIGKIGRRHS